MKRLLLSLVSLLFLVSTASMAQEHAPAAVPSPTQKPGTINHDGEHGGVIVTSGDMKFEISQKAGAFIVFPVSAKQMESFGKAKFTISENGKSVTVADVDYRRGMYLAPVKDDFQSPKVHFETTINGKPYVVEMQSAK